MTTIILEQIWDEKYTIVEYPKGYGLFEDETLLYMIEEDEVNKAVNQGYYNLYGANMKIVGIRV